MRRLVFGKFWMCQLPYLSLCSSLSRSVSVSHPERRCIREAKLHTHTSPGSLILPHAVRSSTPCCLPLIGRHSSHGSPEAQSTSQLFSKQILWPPEHFLLKMYSPSFLVSLWFWTSLAIPLSAHSSLLLFSLRGSFEASQSHMCRSLSQAGELILTASIVHSGPGEEIGEVRPRRWDLISRGAGFLPPCELVWPCQSQRPKPGWIKIRNMCICLKKIIKWATAYQRPLALLRFVDYLGVLAH